MISSSNPKHLSHPEYRADIDGLRAIAVLSVVGFHAFPFWVRGGFIGVDIFFVISGFLISTIIYKNLASDSFSLVEFYSRRIKRIFPALILVLVAICVLGWFVLLADEYKQLGKHMMGGAGFISNLLLWGESGYFDSATESKPLLHLWSLGIEEQYYIFWPVFLWLVWKRGFNLLAITIFILIVSFILNVSQIHIDAVATFYSPQTRFWELLTGSVLAYVTLKRQEKFSKGKKQPLAKLNQHLPAINSDIVRNIQSLSGALLIIISVVVVTKEMYFPGWWAVLPTCGAALIISAGSQAWLNRLILSNRLMVWFGLISFPLYLWHWPLLSFAYIIEGFPSRNIRIAAVFISIALAWLTYKFIEKPIRLGSKGNKTSLILLTLMALVGSFGYLLYSNNGFQGYGYRDPEKSNFANYFENSLPDWKYFKATGMNEKYRTDCNFYDVEKFRIGKSTQVPRNQIDRSCYMRDPAKGHTVFIWGDSHAQHLYYGLNRNLPKDWQVLMVMSAGCKPELREDDSGTDHCQRANWFALKTIREIKPDVVIVAQNAGHDFEKLNKLGDLLLKTGVGKVIFPGPTPHWEGEFPKIILRKLWVNTPERSFVSIDEKIMSENLSLKAKFLKATNENLIFVDLIGFFCNEAGCLTRIGNDKMTGITSFDNGHLTPIASDYLAQKLLVKKVVGAPAH